MLLRSSGSLRWRSDDEDTLPIERPTANHVGSELYSRSWQFRRANARAPAVTVRKRANNQMKRDGVPPALEQLRTSADDHLANRRRREAMGGLSGPP